MPTPAEIRRQRALMQQQRAARRHRGPAHRGPSAAEREQVIEQQNQMSDLLGQLFEGEPTPRLNPDGIPGPATNGVQQALGRFFQTMLGADTAIVPNTLARRVQMLSEAMRAAEADPAAKEALRQRFVAAGATLRGEIGMIGTPNNGFTRDGGNPFGTPRAAPTGPTGAPEPTRVPISTLGNLDVDPDAPRGATGRPTGSPTRNLDVDPDVPRGATGRPTGRPESNLDIDPDAPPRPARSPTTVPRR